MRKLLLPLLFGVTLGCAEMPEIADDVVVKNPRPVSVYTILEDPALPPKLYVRSDQPSVVGIRSGDRIERYGRRDTAHQIDITKWQEPTALTEYNLLIDDAAHEKFYYQIPAENSPVTIGFLGGGRSEISQLQTAAQQLLTLHPNAVVLTGNSIPLDRNLIDFDRFFFAPLQELSRRTPLIFLPEDRKIIPAKAAAPLARPYWARDLGVVRLYFLDVDSLKTPATRQTILDWLARDLSITEKTWRVLVLAQPVFGANEINARLVETFGSLLEDGKVNLIISGGGNYYLRTLPIKSGDTATRYIVSGGLAADANRLLPREYAAELFHEPHIAALTADAEKLTWTVYPLQTGKTRLSAPIDRVAILATGEDFSGEPNIEKVDILTDALAALTLRREVLTIAREAARAVPNPQANVQTLDIVMHNPTGQPVHGALVWQAANDTAWKIKPEAMEFQLQPGYRGVAKFTAERYINVETAPMPELTAMIEGIGSASQPLIFSAKKSKEIFRKKSAEPLVVDGAMIEKEWETAASFADFIALGGGAPRQKFEARALFDDQGIYLLTRAEIGGVPAALAKDHDAAVHHDESVEFFFDPLGEGRDFYQFAVNTRNITLDRSSQLGLAWSPQWQTKVSLHANYYTVEAFIPFTAFGLTQPPAPGAKWGFNIFRNEFLATNRELLETVQTAGKTGGRNSDSRNDAVTAENIASAAIHDLGAKALRENQPAGVVGSEIAQWADTFGSNARAACYGDLIFQSGK